MVLRNPGVPGLWLAVTATAVCGWACHREASQLFTRQTGHGFQVRFSRDSRQDGGDGGCGQVRLSLGTGPRVPVCHSLDARSRRGVKTPAFQLSDPV